MPIAFPINELPIELNLDQWASLATQRLGNQRRQSVQEPLLDRHEIGTRRHRRTREPVEQLMEHLTARGARDLGVLLDDAP